jgi:hypothetical protein
VIHKLLTILTRVFTLIGFINIMMNKEAFHLLFHKQQVRPRYPQGWLSNTFLSWIILLPTLPILTVVGWVAAFSLNKQPSNINNSIHLSKLNNFTWHFQIQRQRRINIWLKPMAIINQMWLKDYRISFTLLHSSE